MDIHKILHEHGLWLRNDAGGSQANLREADLRWADLRGANLREANLCEADLRGADLREAKLRWAKLCWADLRGADLRWADLRGANLYGAKLRWAKLCRADLRGADLDFASWPLWCGSFGVLVDERMVAQLVAHLTRVVPPEDSAYCKAVFDALGPFADRFVEYRPDVRPIATGAGGH